MPNNDDLSEIDHDAEDIPQEREISLDEWFSIVLKAHNDESADEPTGACRYRNPLTNEPLCIQTTRPGCDLLKGRFRPNRPCGG